MDVRFQTLSKGAVRLDAVIIPTILGTPTFFSERFAADLPWLGTSEALADHSGKLCELTVCYGPSSSLIPRVILVGLGTGRNIPLEDFHKAVGTAMRACRSLRLGRIGFMLETVFTAAEMMGKPAPRVLEELAFAFLVSAYSCTEYKSAEAKAKGKKNREVEFFEPDSLVVLHDGRTISASLRHPVKLAEVTAASVCLARDMVNAPSNIMTPARLAEEAAALAKRHGFTCRILHKAEMAKLGMGGLLAVNEGSNKDPRFIVLEHNPGGLKKRPPLMLVGKGITFDSGGISLKPAAGMDQMKGDMAGAAAVLGTFEAIGRLPESFSWPVVGLIPCTENMPDGNAMRPGDIITTMAGITVEVLNTDAEGRLILCDALTYAQKNWKPLAIVDIATLTGACAVALGRNAAGLFTDSEALRDMVMEIGRTGGETFWPMPLWERLREGLKSGVADIANVGAREGGAISAALFLKTFVDANIPWAHIDMAGASIQEKDTPICPKGATGFGARSLIELARRASEKMFRN